MVPETLAQVSTAMERLASVFHDEMVQLSARGDALLAAWTGRAGPTFAEPVDDWRRAAADVVERLRTAAVLIAQAGTSFDEASRA